MANFSTGFKEYLEHSGVKVSYVSEVSGINESKLLRIINGEEPATEKDMLAISSSLGLDVDYFLNCRFLDVDPNDAEEEEFERCLASLTPKQANIIRALDSYLASASYILGAPKRLEQMALHMDDESPWT